MGTRSPKRWGCRFPEMKLPLGLGDVLEESTERPLRVTLGEGELIGVLESEESDDGLKVKHVVELALPHGLAERPGEVVAEGQLNTLLLALVDALARGEELEVRERRLLALSLGDAEAHRVGKLERDDEVLKVATRDALALPHSRSDKLGDGVED